MAKDPSILWYTSDFLTGTALFSNEELGFYTRLLAHQHQQGNLSEIFIKKMAGRKYEKLWEAVKLKFKKDEQGLFFNERMKLEMEKRSLYSKKQSERAAKGWHSRGNAVAMPMSENENENDLGKSENPLPAKKEKWITMPTEVQAGLALTEIEIGGCIEFVYSMKQVHLTNSQLIGYWKAFKIQHFTGGKFYQDRSRCLQHFRNWIKGQDISELNLKATNQNGIPKRLKTL